MTIDRDALVREVAEAISAKLFEKTTDPISERVHFIASDLAATIALDLIVERLGNECESTCLMSLRNKPATK